MDLVLLFFSYRELLVSSERYTYIEICTFYWQILWKGRILPDVYDQLLCGLKASPVSFPEFSVVSKKRLEDHGTSPPRITLNRK
ncbi:hypothetical protein FKM82_020700 [Ascaphus truei]